LMTSQYKPRKKLSSRRRISRGALKAKKRQLVACSMVVKAAKVEHRMARESENTG
jgi:hypothetical protein